jgi:hypothetical protein
MNWTDKRLNDHFGVMNEINQTHWKSINELTELVRYLSELVLVMAESQGVAKADIKQLKDSLTINLN